MKAKIGQLKVLMMLKTPINPQAPADWLQSLERSKAQIAAGQTVPLLPILDRLRSSAEHLETKMGVSPDDESPSQARSLRSPRKPATRCNSSNTATPSSSGHRRFGT